MSFSAFKTKWELPIIAMIFLAAFAMSINYVEFFITRAKLTGLFSAWQTGRIAVAEHFAWHGNFPNETSPSHITTGMDGEYHYIIEHGTIYAGLLNVRAKQVHFSLTDIFSRVPTSAKKEHRSVELSKVWLPMRPGLVKTDVSPTLVWACGESQMPVNINAPLITKRLDGVELLPHTCRRNNEGKPHVQ